MRTKIADTLPAKECRPENHENPDAKRESMSFLLYHGFPGRRIVNFLEKVP